MSADSEETENFDLSAYGQPESLISGEENSSQIKTPSKLSPARWLLIFFVLLFSFSLLKMPTDRLAQVVVAKINQSVPGLSIVAQEGDFSLLWRQLSLEKIKVNYQNYNMSPLQLDVEEMTVNPRLLSLIFKKISSKVWIKIDNADIDIDVTAKNQEIESLIMEIEDLNLAKLIAQLARTQPALPQIQGELQSDIEFSGSLMHIKDMFGRITLELSKFALPNIPLPVPGMSLTLPAMQIGQGEAEINIGDAKALIKKFSLGSKSDDVLLKVTGNADLNEGNVLDSKFDLEISLWLSDKLKKAIPGLDLFMNPYKKDDTYAFRLKGNRQFALPSAL